jgi:hypothetical protein
MVGRCLSEQCSGNRARLTSDISPSGEAPRLPRRLRHSPLARGIAVTHWFGFVSTSDRKTVRRAERTIPQPCQITRAWHHRSSTSPRWAAWSFPAPRNKRQDFQEQSIRDAEIPPDDYYPKGYKPELIPFWPTSEPIVIPAEQVPPGLWLKGKPAAAAQPAPDGEASKSPEKR